jgi:hypothetical protein
MSFSSSAGENGILETPLFEEPEPTYSGVTPTPDPVKGHALCSEMPLPADHEAKRDPCREGNDEVVKPEVKFG